MLREEELLSSSPTVLSN